MISSPQITDFELSPELQEFREKVREYSEWLAPQAHTFDEEAAFPADAVAKAAKLGFLALTTPAENGGSAMGNLANCIMLEEINAACPSTGVTISVHNSLFCSPFHKWGTEEQRNRYSPKLVTGEWLGAYCLSEAGSGSDAAGLRCEARRDGDDWILNGPKLWITTGSEAGLFIVFARSGEHRIKGISAYLVERDYPGVAIGKKERKLGLRGSPTNEIQLENVRVPGSNLLGEEGNGFTIALDTLDGGRLGIAAQSLGITRACLDLIGKQLSIRKDARGRPRASQTDQWSFADLATRLEGCRMLTWRAAILRDQEKNCTVDSAMAKLSSSILANEAGREAVRICGLVGGTPSTEAARFMRDARITEIYEGVTDIQRLVIARALLVD